MARKRIRTWKTETGTVRIACWNITSFTNKDQELLIELDKHKIDICAISETKKKGKGSIKFENHVLIYSGKNKEDRASSGVGLMIHEKFSHFIEKVEYVSDRLLHVSVVLNKTRPTHIISDYAPDISKPQELKNQFYSSLQQLLDTISASDEVILLGDFNSRVGNRAISGVTSRFNEDECNENGHQLIQFCLQNELRINNTFFDHKQQHKITFSNTRGHASTIDYIITNRNIHPSRILDVRVLSSANLGTDHNLVLGKIRSNKSHRRQEEAAPNFAEKYNIESFKNPSTQYLYQCRLCEKFNQNSINTEDDVEIVWKKIKDNIIAAAEEAVGKRKIKLNNKRMNTKPWFCNEIKTYAAEKSSAYLKYKNKQLTYDQYKSVRNRINASIRNIKKEYWERFSAEMEHDLYGGQKKIWNMLRNRKKNINELFSFTNISISEWEDYFKNLFNEASYDDCPSNCPRVASAGNYTISSERVSITIKKLKNRKSPGMDGIHNEMIKYSNEAISEELANFFQKILDTGRVPLEWKESITIPIFKKGDKKDPGNYRGITLLSSILKLFTKILAEEIACAGINEEQQGFRKNRSTTDAIFILRQIIEKSIEFNCPVYLCFVDLTKAFDRVLLRDVIDILTRKHVDNNIISVIKDMNNDNSTYIKSNNIISSKLPIATGIRQGDNLSPILFNTIMDEIINDVNDVTHGFNISNKEVKILCYADDAVLMANSEDDLQRLLYSFEKSSQKYNMRISTSKTKSLTISKDPLRCKLAVYGKSIEQVMEFNYLGAKITSSKNVVDEVRNQSEKAARVSGCLRDIIWKNKSMSIKSKVRIYKTCVRPIMTYGIETRADTTTTERIISTVEMQTLRAIAGYTRRDLKRNEEIREMCEITDVVKWSRKRRKGWNQHVKRMGDDRLAKIVMKGQLKTPRPPGRPPKRWHECWTSGSRSE